MGGTQTRPVRLNGVRVPDTQVLVVEELAN